jgi:hypothetical protein
MRRIILGYIIDKNNFSYELLMLIYDKRPKYLAERGPVVDPRIAIWAYIKKNQRYIPAFVPAIFLGLVSANKFAVISPVTAAAEAELSSSFPVVLFLSMLS